MAKNKSANKGKKSRKKARTVSYLLNGRMVTRTIGVRTTPFSQNELATQLMMKVVQKFLNSIEAFIHVGYELEAKLKNLNQQNVSFSYHRKHAVTGVYPDLKIDFPNVMVTMGNLNPPVEPKAIIVGDKIVFSWTHDPEAADQQWTDQVMLLAYFPERGKAVYITAGAGREEQAESLRLPRSLKFSIVETYIAFISIDRRRISNSIYTGQITK